MDTYGHSHRNIACPLHPCMGAPRRVGEASHITFPLPKASPDGKIVWPRHGSADLLGQTYQTRSPPFVMWAFPAFERCSISSGVPASHISDPGPAWRQVIPKPSSEGGLYTGTSDPCFWRQQTASRGHVKESRRATSAFGGCDARS